MKLKDLLKETVAEISYEKSGLKKPNLADLDKDKKISSWEKKRGGAIEKNMKTEFKSQAPKKEGIKFGNEERPMETMPSLSRSEMTAMDSADGGVAEGMDHEVSMAKASLQNIISNASALLNKLGDDEIDIPAWVQDHITNSDNYISQANDGYYEYEAGENNEIPDQEIYETKGTSIFGADDKRGDYPVGDLEYRRQKNNQALAQRKNNYPPPTEKVVLTQKKNTRKWKT